MRRTFCGIVLAAFFVTLAMPAEAAHFVSVRRDKAYLREGPTFHHKVLWIYRRKDYPLEVIASYDAWRRVRDRDGTTGWMNQNMLSDERTAVVIGRSRIAIRASPRKASAIIAWAEPGVVGRLRACKPDMCEIVADGVSGWIDRAIIWGVEAGEVF